MKAPDIVEQSQNFQKTSSTDVLVPLASAAAVDLFACIARFEFALKETGFVTGEENGRACRPSGD